MLSTQQFSECCNIKPGRCYLAVGMSSSDLGAATLRDTASRSADSLRIHSRMRTEREQWGGGSTGFIECENALPSSKVTRAWGG